MLGCEKYARNRLPRIFPAEIHQKRTCSGGTNPQITKVYFKRSLPRNCFESRILDPYFLITHALKNSHRIVHFGKGLSIWQLVPVGNGDPRALSNIAMASLGVVCLLVRPYLVLCWPFSSSRWRPGAAHSNLAGTTSIEGGTGPGTCYSSRRRSVTRNLLRGWPGAPGLTNRLAATVAASTIIGNHRPARTYRQSVTVCKLSRCFQPGTRLGPGVLSESRNGMPWTKRTRPGERARPTAGDHGPRPAGVTMRDSEPGSDRPLETHAGSDIAPA